MNFRRFSVAGGLVLATLTGAAAQQPSHPADATTQQTPTSESRTQPKAATPSQEPGQSQGQASPQGATGPMNTTTGGVSPASPQGETPAGMQPSPGNSTSQGTERTR